MEEKAREFAIQAYKDQTYGDGTHPYWKHLGAVVQIAKEYQLPESVVVAAWLHDTVEDTPTTVEDSIQTFGIDIAKLVWTVTDDFPNLPRKIKQPKTWMKIKMLRETKKRVLNSL